MLNCAFLVLGLPHERIDDPLRHPSWPLPLHHSPLAPYSVHAPPWPKSPFRNRATLRQWRTANSWKWPMLIVDVTCTKPLNFHSFVSFTTGCVQKCRCLSTKNHSIQLAFMYSTLSPSCSRCLMLNPPLLMVESPNSSLHWWISPWMPIFGLFKHVKLPKSHKHIQQLVGSNPFCWWFNPNLWLIWSDLTFLVFMIHPMSYDG